MRSRDLANQVQVKKKRKKVTEANRNGNARKKFKWHTDKQKCIASIDGLIEYPYPAHKSDYFSRT